MGYEWPSDVVAGDDILAPSLFNETMQNTSETMNNLDAHNIQASDFRTNATVGTHAYGTIHYAGRVVDPGFGTVGTYGYPSKVVTNVFQVQNNGTWQAVTDASISSITTGQSDFRVDASIQYIWFDWKGTNLVVAYDHVSHSDATYQANALPCKVQFAIRIDGVVVESSITGHHSLRNREFWPIKGQPERNVDNFSGTKFGSQPGPATPKTPRLYGMGPECMSVVLQCAIQVEPGTHTIDIVARRAMPPSAGGRLASSVVDEVYVYTRQLIAEEYPIWAPTTSTSSQISVDAIDTETVLSSVNMYTNRLDVLRANLNSLPQQAIKKHSLRYDHLPTILLKAASANITPAAVQTTTDWYPGYVSTFAGAKTGATGWFLIDDGAGNNLSISSTYTVTAVSSSIRIKAHVHVSSIEDSSAVHPLAKGFFGAFAIGYYSNGAWTIIQNSIAFMNSFNICNNGSAANPEETNQALLGFLDYRSGVGSHDITSFGVFACGFPNAQYGGGYIRANVKWLQGYIGAIQFRL